jgi:hypothetical protein
LYKIQRRIRPEEQWQDVATAIETESTLVDQPKGKELEYRDGSAGCNSRI